MIRIAFICGSLEPGRDGVGDYTMRLAEALTNLGHHIAIIAANDSHLTKERYDTINASIRTLRIPSGYEHAQRFGRMHAFIQQFNPEWISIQFVPFSFHHKGLPFAFVNRLARLTVGFKVHVMFHELWVGMDKAASVKFRLWSAIQKQLIINFLKKTKPKRVHTQTDLYQAQLNLSGFEADILPLFGNIPVTAKKSLTMDDTIINLVIFGGIHYGAPAGQFAHEVAEYAIAHQKTIILNFVGRCGAEQEKWITAWTNGRLEVKVWGAQSEEKISEILSASTAGITTTPESLVQKSGSVAAMKEHGLPVLCVSRDWKPRVVSDLPNVEGVLTYKPGNFGKLFQMKSTEMGSVLNKVTHQFLLTLSK